MKTCRICKITKIDDEFHKPQYRRPECKACRKVLSRQYYEKHKEKIKQRVQAYRLANLETIVEKKKVYAKANLDKARIREHRWRKNNPGVVKATLATKRANRIKATPKWLSKIHKDQIRKIYENCPQGWHVDHIVPLRGINVRGLHVPWNLQYLPALDNIRKGNKV